MTVNEAIRCYIAACPDDNRILAPTDPRRANVAQEVSDIVAAKTLREARAVIGWWRNPWAPGELARTINAIRRAAGVGALR